MSSGRGGSRFRPLRLALTFAGAAMTACSGDTPVDPPIDPSFARCTQEFGDPALSPYVLPFPAGHSYELFQGKCPPNPAWGHHGWLAYDFDLAIGDTILASRAGRVSFVENRWPNSDRVCGHENAVWITHADGTVLAYLHLTTNGALVRVGDQVQAGEVIGLSGDSGCSSGPHLHVGLFRNGSNFDKENSVPLNYHNADGPVDEKHALIQGQRYAVRSE